MMVVFTCNNCGEALHKQRVAKHYQFQCRQNVFLTCADCFKDFRGEEYVAHTKCITENERYGGKDYVPKAGANKGERKQNEWINVVNNLLVGTTKMSNAERCFLTNLSRFDNIPRKKAKFLNFVRSALGNRTSMPLVESVWSIMENSYKNSIQDSGKKELQKNVNDKSNEVNDEGADKSFSNENQENNIAENQNNENICKENNDQVECNESKESGDDEGENIRKRKNSKKRVMSENAEQSIEQPVLKKKKSASVESTNRVANACVDKLSFNWKNTILELVQKKGEISIKKLQKKVISRYMNHASNEITQEKASSKFNKKLKKVTEIVLYDNKVKLA